MDEDFPIDIHYAELAEWALDRRAVLEKTDRALFRQLYSEMAPRLMTLAKVEVPALQKAVARITSTQADAVRRLEDARRKHSDSIAREKALLARIGVAALTAGSSPATDPPSVMDLVDGVHSEAERCRWEVSRNVFRVSASHLSGVLDLFDSLVVEASDAGMSVSMFPRLCDLARISASSLKLCTDERCSRTVVVAEARAGVGGGGGSGIDWGEDEAASVAAATTTTTTTTAESATDLLLRAGDDVNAAVVPHADHDRTLLLDELCALEVFFSERAAESEALARSPTVNFVQAPRITEAERNSVTAVASLRAALSEPHAMELIRMSTHHQAMEKFLCEVEQSRLLQQRHRAAEDDWASRLEAANAELAVVRPDFISVRSELKNLQKQCEAAVKTLLGGKRDVYFVGDINKM